MRLCVITDEISDDVDHALRVAESLGIGAAEIRVVGGRNIVEHDPAVWRRVAATLTAGGFSCPVVDSPFLKYTPVAGDDDWGEVDWAPFERAIEVAHLLDAGIVRVFSGRRRSIIPGRRLNGREPGGLDPGVAGWLTEVLTDAGRRARSADLRIAVEVEHECTIATAAEANAALGGWGYVLDPGNESYLTGQPASAALIPVLLPRIRHVHVKDVDAQRRWAKVGSGLVDWPAQLAALAAGGYDGHLSMETHYATGPDGLETATRESVAALRDIAAVAGIELQ